MFRKSSALFICILFGLLILAACTAAAVPPTATLPPPTSTPIPPTDTPIPPTNTPEPTPTKSDLIVSEFLIMGKAEVNGRKLFVRCSGKGSPTLILVNGLGVDLAYFYEYRFFDTLKRVTRTCAYDRPNTGMSASAPGPRTAQDAADDLHALLTNISVPGPYILAGHSWGGWIVLLYADQYPDDVAGVILLDSSHPYQGERFIAALPTESPDEPYNISEERRSWEKWYKAAYERMDLATSVEQVRAVTSLGDIPLYVLTAWNGETRFTPEQNQSLNDAWLNMQLELAALSTNSTQVTIEGAEHILWFKELEQVIQWITQMVEELRE